MSDLIVAQLIGGAVGLLLGRILFFDLPRWRDRIRARR